MTPLAPTAASVHLTCPVDSVPNVFANRGDNLFFPTQVFVRTVPLACYCLPSLRLPLKSFPSFPAQLELPSSQEAAPF